MAKPPTKKEATKTPIKKPPGGTSGPKVSQEAGESPASSKASRKSVSNHVSSLKMKPQTAAAAKAVVAEKTARTQKQMSDQKPGQKRDQKPAVKFAEVEIIDSPSHEQQDEGEASELEGLDEDIASQFDFPVATAEIDPDREILESDAITPVIIPEIVDSESGSKALATMDPVATYLAEIRRYPLLTKEQERELAIRYRETGDPKAAEMLVTSNLRFVVKVAAEYSRFGAKLIDLVQEGNVGLMHAVKEFNPYKGVRLITYAVWWIRGYIQEYLMRQYSLVRIGTTQNQRKLFYRLQKERQALGAAGHEPTNALLAGRLGVTEEEVETMSKRLSGRDVSLSTPLDDSGSASTLLDFEASDEAGVDDRIGHMEEIQVLRTNLEKIRPTLTEKEMYILSHRVLADEPMTLQEIGEHYGVTREAVRQIEARLIGKIRSAVTQSLEAIQITDED